MKRRKVLILGAGGRDFHNFNTVFRGHDDVEVVAFTATQIPHIADRRYPPSLAGPGYPSGIPIRPERELEELLRAHGPLTAVFSYSDVNYETLGHLISRVTAGGSDFALLGTESTMIRSKIPVIAVTAVRTGAGKSQTTRRVAELLTERKVRTVVVRHPMPYGDLEKQAVQRLASPEDLDRHECTIEEREEYEPHIDRGSVVYAGVDYGRILAQAEAEADVILWDGGNNDLPFYHPDLHITVLDPHRPGHELRYHPGETNLRLAQVVVVNKVASADPAGVATVVENARRVNPGAQVILADSPLLVSDPEAIRGKRVLVVEDGPTLTHGEMSYGAGVIAARRFGAREIVDPRPWVQGEIAETFANYPGIGALLPAMGYGRQQIEDLERTIDAVEADLVIVATPIDLGRILRLSKPAVRVTYELEETGSPKLSDVVDAFLSRVAATAGRRREGQ